MINYDVFYEIKTKKSLTTVKEILGWAKSHAFKTEIHMRIKGKLTREKADKNYREVLRLVTKEQIIFLRIVLHKNLNWFPNLSKEAKNADVLEIFIRGMDIKDREYFLIMWLEEHKLEELQKMYQLQLVE